MAKRPVPQAKKRVYIVDRDRTVCETLGKTFASFGYEVRVAASPSALAGVSFNESTCCLLLDVSFADQSAFELQDELKRVDAPVDIVFMTGQGDISMAVNAMKRGAVDFLTKPLRMSELLPAVDAALQRSAVRREARRRHAQFTTRIARLTPREREVLTLVLRGQRNKQIADTLASQESTVKVHRSRLMRKLEVRTLAELLRLGAELDARPERPPIARGYGAAPAPGPVTFLQHAGETPFPGIAL